MGPLFAKSVDPISKQHTNSDRPGTPPSKIPGNASVWIPFPVQKTPGAHTRLSRAATPDLQGFTTKNFLKIRFFAVGCESRTKFKNPVGGQALTRPGQATDKPGTATDAPDTADSPDMRVIRKASLGRLRAPALFSPPGVPNLINLPSPQFASLLGDAQTPLTHR